MPLTRPKAHQFEDSDYKQSVRLLSASNVTLSGGAPATLDGATLALGDRILVTGQSAGAENGLYKVSVVGSGSNGTWVRTRDGDDTGDITAGMITYIESGTTYADQTWKLTTDNPITLGSTALTFEEQASAAVGGSNTQVQFNDGGDLGGDAGLTYNKSTDALSVGGKINITNTALTDSMTLTTTEDSSTAGPVIALKRNSSSPADADYLGQLKFLGENDADQEITYAKITGKISDASDGTEDGIIEFMNKKGGTNTITARLRYDSLQLLNGTQLSVNGASTFESSIDVTGSVTASTTMTATGNITGGNVTTAGTMQADLLKNREQRYTTSNMMKFNQMYTGASNGSYFTNGEYQKVVTITPDGDSQNYQVVGRIMAQNAGETHTVFFDAALRSGTLPDLSWSYSYREEYNGSRYIDPQLWTKETTTAGWIFAFKTLATIYGTVTVDMDVIPRNSSQLSNVSVNTTQNSEQTSVDTGFTANDMTKVQTRQTTDYKFYGDIDIADADSQFIHGDTGYKNKRYVLYGTTTDGTATEILIGGTADSRISIPTDTTVYYTVDIVARRTDATGESGAWHLKGVADNFSGTVADVGNVYEVIVAQDDTNWAVDVIADDDDNAINVVCTGAASKTIKWVAVVNTMEVTT